MANTYLRIFVNDIIAEPKWLCLDETMRGHLFTLILFSAKTGGELRQCEGGEGYTMTDLSYLLRVKEENQCTKILSELVSKGWLAVTNDGVYQVPLVMEDLKSQKDYVDAKREKATSAANARWKKQDNALAMQTQCTSNADALQPHLPSTCLEDARAMHPIPYPYPYINTNSKTRAREGEENGVIAPPPGMPKNEEEAIAMAEPAGIPDWFVREKAYPKLLSTGYRDNNNVVRNFVQWCKFYYLNYQNSEARRGKPVTQQKKSENNYVIPSL